MIKPINTINSFYEDMCIKIYNPENKQLIGVFKNFAKAANKLGVHITILSRKCGNKERLFSPSLNIEVACRLNKITEEDLKNIKKTEIKFPYDLQTNKSKSVV